MKTRMFTIICLALSVALVGCEKQASGDAKDDEAKAEAPADKSKDKANKAEDEEEAAAEKGEAAEDEAPAEQVEVATGGTKFDPAIKPEQLPEGAYYCDMGTVHWAAMEKPEDGKCPECGMKLKQYDAEEHAAKKKGAVEAKDDHGHDHGDDDHAHGDDHPHGDDDHAHGDDDHAHGDDDHAHEGDDHGHSH